MGNICDKVKLSTRYTNHCIRVTGVTNLRRANFNAKQVMSVSGHKSVDSLAVYERVQSDEKLMMGMCLTFTLLHPEEAIMIKNSLEVQEKPKETPPSKALPAPTVPEPTPLQEVQNVPQQQKEIIPLENAIAPYQPHHKVSDTPDFDLMALIAEVENQEIPDEEMVLAATQCEQSLTTPQSTSTTKALMKKTTTTNTAPTFTGCTFGSIGTINIHIHKH